MWKNRLNRLKAPEFVLHTGPPAPSLVIHLFHCFFVSSFLRSFFFHFFVPSFLIASSFFHSVVSSSHGFFESSVLCSFLSTLSFLCFVVLLFFYSSLPRFPWFCIPLFHRSFLVLFFRPLTFFVSSFLCSIVSPFQLTQPWYFYPSCFNNLVWELSLGTSSNEIYLSPRASS